ncbi:MAG: hypothetical protein K2X11_02200, partial [Acetobacteraceae bacterium]|nr:hypothetical protein [Acetobacteraceae bacterium]
MMDAVIAAGERLADALRAENEALAALDLTRAAALATRKLQATDAFAAATAAAARLRARPEGALRAETERLASSLAQLGAENRRLLEEAIALQSRVIETIAGVARPRQGAPGYGAAGRRRGAVQSEAMA